MTTVLQGCHVMGEFSNLLLSGIWNIEQLNEDLSMPVTPGRERERESERERERERE